ncbi:MAG: MCE family protein [Deltaproteobacteria bacterium]|nr:MAG: MCE family protein [Deltaproteobacteria bacterium]
MGKKANPAIIGAFVIGAVALAVVAVTVWGSGKLFRRQYPCVCYFPGSVNGLSAGAPVKFRGVQIGEVSDVRLLYAQTRGSPRIPVFLKIDNERMRGLGSKRELSLELLRELIDQGLRARLQTQSIVTGVLYVEFDLLPGTPVEMMQEPDAGYPEIPTLPTPLAEATKTVSDVLAQLKKVDFKGLGVAAREAVDGVNRLVSNPRMTAAIDGLPDAIAAARRLLADLDERTAPLGDGVRNVSADTRQTLASLRATLEAIQAMVAPDAPLSVGLTETVTDLSRAARAVGDLADFLERNPSAVVFGQRRP